MRARRVHNAPSRTRAPLGVAEAGCKGPGGPLLKIQAFAFLTLSLLALSQALAPATPTAPAGSRMDRVSLNTSCRSRGGQGGQGSGDAGDEVARMARCRREDGCAMPCPTPLGWFNPRQPQQAPSLGCPAHLDGGADGAVADEDDAVQQLAAQPERLLAHLHQTTRAATAAHRRPPSSRHITPSVSPCLLVLACHASLPLPCPGLGPGACKALTCLTATPSAKASTRDSAMRSPRWRLCAMALAPVGSTPMICGHNSSASTWPPFLPHGHTGLPRVWEDTWPALAPQQPA